MSDVPGKDIRYNRLEYRQYSERLRARCNQNKHAAKVLCGVFKDPVTSFVAYKADAAALFAHDEKPSEQEVLEDPTTHLTTFIGAMLGKDADDDAGFTETIKQKLEDDITNWMVGESTIYAIAAESLRGHPKLISSNTRRPTLT